ncbi:hypothetical protein U1Q18_001907 [Sarracenia purpurea var. burkii]
MLCMRPKMSWTALLFTPPCTRREAPSPKSFTGLIIWRSFTPSQKTFNPSGIVSMRLTRSSRLDLESFNTSKESDPPKNCQGSRLRLSRKKTWLVLTRLPKHWSND